MAEQLEELGESILAFIREQKALILFITIPILTVVIGLLSWHVTHHFGSTKRQDALAVIDDKRSLALKNHQKAMEFLQSELQKLEATFDTATTAKKASLQEKINTTQPDFTEVGKQYEEFFQAHSQTQEGRVAGVQAAQIFMQQESYPKALEIFSQIFTGDHTLGLFYDIYIRPVYAGLLEEMEMHEQALSETEKILAVIHDLKGMNSIASSIEPDLLFSKARLGAALKDSAAVSGAVDQLVGKYPSHEETRLALTIQMVSASK